MQPPSFSLKAPTLLSVFIFIALRALRADAGYVLLAGVVAAAGWTALIAYALAESPPGAVTHDFIDYVTSDRILLGAEIEKIIAILSVTGILALAISRARGLLIRLVTERSAARELSRFFDPGIAARIRDAKHHTRAGRGEACEGAILIFDIRGFTALFDHLAPDEVMALLAEYQARPILIIQNHGGSIDKFLGDRVIATFARPSPAYAADAVVMLDEALAAIDRWNPARRTAGLDAVAVNAALTIGRREVVDPMIKEHPGRIVRITVDGLLVEFVSVVDAVRCAADTQREMALRNGEVPVDQRIEFRMNDEKDIYGDGVNVAARLEALAPPGGICVSRVVRDHVRDKLNFTFDDRGEQQVKNIAPPVRVFDMKIARETMTLTTGQRKALAHTREEGGLDRRPGRATYSGRWQAPRSRQRELGVLNEDGSVIAFHLTKPSGALAAAQRASIAASNRAGWSLAPHTSCAKSGG